MLTMRPDTNMKTRRWIAATLMCALGAGTVSAAEHAGMEQLDPPVEKSLPVEGRLPSLDHATAWLNSPRISADSMRGKVVLIDFWTYTCINWRRTLPYLREWAQKYKNQNLVVIGVHTPEFGFERDLDNVRRNAKDENVEYPIAVDSDYAIWRAFDNHYWPALYFIDAEGRIRHHVFGEGEYEQSEQIIQQLLAEAGHSGVDRSLVAPNAQGAEVAADWNSLASPETYLGYERQERFVSPGRGLFDRTRIYTAPARLGLNNWALSGDWTIKRGSIVSNNANGKVIYRFRARDVHLVMAPKSKNTRVRFRVLLDGNPPGTAHGVDVDEDGRGTRDGPRMYQLIRQASPIIEREFVIEFLDAGAEAFSFTFG